MFVRVHCTFIFPVHFTTGEDRSPTYLFALVRSHQSVDVFVKSREGLFPMSYDTQESCSLEVQPPFFIGWFPNHHYFSRGLSSSKRNHHFQSFQEIFNRTHVSRTPKKPEYLIARSQLTERGPLV